MLLTLTVFNIQFKKFKIWKKICGEIFQILVQHILYYFIHIYKLQAYVFNGLYICIYEIYIHMQHDCIVISIFKILKNIYIIHTSLCVLSVHPYTYSIEIQNFRF